MFSTGKTTAASNKNIVVTAGVGATDLAVFPGVLELSEIEAVAVRFRFVVGLVVLPVQNVSGLDDESFDFAPIRGKRIWF